MAFNRNQQQRRNFGGGSGYGRNMSPWESANNFRGNEALALANNLITNLLRTQPNAPPPSLLEMAARGRYDNFGGYPTDYDRVRISLILADRFINLGLNINSRWETEMEVEQLGATWIVVPVVGFESPTQRTVRKIS